MHSASPFHLFCFPPGGTGASLYRSWSKYFGKEIKIVPVQFPGREERYADQLLTAVSSLVEDALSIFKDPPRKFAFFGHSLGALVGFEIARELRRHKMACPAVLFVSGYPAPSIRRDRPRISHLAKHQFLDKLAADFDVATTDRSLLEFAYPILRSDFEAVESYQFEPDEPLDCRIVALGGKNDREATEPQLRAWQGETLRPLRIAMFPGDHFYLYSSTNAIALLIQQELGLQE